MLDYVLNGGPIVWPLLLSSIVGVTIIIERLWFFLSLKKKNTRLLELLSGYVRNEPVRTAISEIQRTKGPVGNLAREFVTAIKIKSPNPSIIETRLKRSVYDLVKVLESNLVVLDVVRITAPLLGILGTVWGIIVSFHGVSSDPNMLSNGIAQALITTALGLIIAIIATIFHAFFDRQIDKIIDRVERIREEAMETISLREEGRIE